jgi:hypothetical protein
MMGAWGRRLVGGLSVLLLAAGTALAGSTGAGAAPRTGEVYVVHGIVGVTADILVDGDTVAEDAGAKTVVGPLDLSAGQHLVTLRDGSSTVATARFSVAAGASIDVVAHRTADASRTPRIMVFKNNLSPVGPGKTRLVVSHTAVAPPADIRVDGEPLFRNVASGESLSLVVPAKTYSVDVTPSSGGAKILAPVSLTLRPGTLTRVFAIGDPAEDTADAIVQVIRVGTTGAGAPSRVPTGDGGQAADEILAAGLLPGGAPVAVLTVGLGLMVIAVLGRGPAGARGLRSRHSRS